MYLINFLKDFYGCFIVVYMVYVYIFIMYIWRDIKLLLLFEIKILRYLKVLLILNVIEFVCIVSGVDFWM